MDNQQEAKIIKFKKKRVTKPRIVLPKNMNTSTCLSLAGGVVYRMTNNSYFPDPSPPLDHIKEAIASTRLAQAKRGTLRNYGSSEDVREMHRQTKNLTLLIKALAKYVEHVAYSTLGNDHMSINVVLTSSGFATNRKR